MTYIHTYSPKQNPIFLKKSQKKKDGATLGCTAEKQMFSDSRWTQGFCLFRYKCVKRDLVQRNKRPTNARACVKRDLVQRKKRPTNARAGVKRDLVQRKKRPTNAC